jgi:hypothetical protein
MSTVEQIIKNEPVKDVVSVFALFRPASAVDRMYGCFNQEVILNGELAKAYNLLLMEGVLASDENGKTVKGPNWKAPDFFIEKRYV